MTLSAEARADPPRRATGHALILAALVLGVAGLGLAGRALPFGAKRTPDAALQDLAAAAEGYRAIVPRVTGGFRHAPCPVERDERRLVAGLVCRAPPDRTAPDRLLRFASELRSARGASTAGLDPHKAGVFGLLWPHVDGSLTAAVRDLRAAADAGSPRADMLSDLAAALLTVAAVSQDPLSLLDAFSAADSAVTLEPRHPEALFNRALALERLYLRTDAARAWRDYLAVDAGSAWASEARQHLALLTAQPARWEAGRLRAAAARSDTVALEEIVRSAPARARTFVHQLLVQWARAVVEAKAHDADSLLAVAAAAARALERQTRDGLDADAAAAAAAARGDAARTRTLAHGVLALDSGEARLRSFDLAAADRLLSRAAAELRSGGSPLHWRARFRLGQATYQRHDPRAYDRALAVFEAFERQVPPRYRLIRALAASHAGLIYSIRAHHEAALQAYVAAVAEAAGTGEPEILVRTQSWLSDAEFALRGPDHAWRSLYGALKAALEAWDAPRIRRSVFVQAAIAARQSHPTLAVLFQQEAVRVATEMGDAAFIVASRGRLAEFLVLAGKDAAAAGELRAAEQLLGAIPNDSIRAIQQDDVNAVTALATLRSDPTRAAQLLARVVQHYRATDNFLPLARAYLYQARAYLALGRTDSAELAFEAAVAESERARELIGSHLERAQFLDHVRPVFDQIVAFHAARADADRAFEFFERARARVLLEQITAGGGRTPPARAYVPAPEIRQRLARDRCIVSYAVLHDRLLIFVVRHDGVRLVSVQTPGRDVERSVQALQQAVLRRGSPGELEDVAARLYETLIRPVADLVAGQRGLVVVPDKWLHFVPFAALWNRGERRFLVEQFEIVVAPSASIAVSLPGGQAGVGEVSRLRVLAVGNPAFDRRSFHLPELPGAEAEARRVAANYPEGRLLVGARATRDTFVAQLGRADVVHFAGHAVVRTDAPQLSYLVLAADSPDRQGGALYAWEIHDLALPRTRLAILSGCHTAGGRLSATEGPSSLARALFAAGVPAVVASLWAVDDEETAAFFEVFHRHLAAGAAPSAALRAAQLEWIRSPERRSAAATWAAFQAFGAAG